MSKIQNLKEQKKEMLLHKTGGAPTTRAIILLDIQDGIVKQFLVEAANYLNIHLVHEYHHDVAHWYDAVITDGSSWLDLVSLMQHAVVPIVARTHSLIDSLREFDPMKFEWNAFIYDMINPYLIFEKLVRYLENIRYPGDKRTLLSNVGKTF